jgi:hypothetical protein
MLSMLANSLSLCCSQSSLIGLLHIHMVHGSSSNKLFITGALQVFDKIFKWQNVYVSHVVAGWYNKVTFIASSLLQSMYVCFL